MHERLDRLQPALEAVGHDELAQTAREACERVLHVTEDGLQFQRGPDLSERDLEKLFCVLPHLLESLGGVQHLVREVGKPAVL